MKNCIMQYKKGGLSFRARYGALQILVIGGIS